MSTRSKIVLVVSCVASTGIIFGVHYKQQLDRDRMHQGVVRDMEVQDMKRRQNMVLLDQQTALTQLLRDQEKSTDLK